jgi:hypothetical protein
MEYSQTIELFYFFEDSFIGQYIRNSTWLFPIIESFHLLGLAMLGGSVVIADFRLMGLVLKTESNSYVLLQTKPWFKLGLCLLVLTGVPLFLSEAVKCYYSRAFWIKMTCLVIGIAFTFFVRNPLVLKIENGKLISLLGFSSFLLWTVVAASGRWIGFS